MMVMCNASVVIEHGTRSSGLSNAPVLMEYGDNIIEE